MEGVDPRERFAGEASGYARCRPSYPDALVDRLVSAAEVREGDRVADVGCGTGIFTRLLAARGLEVVGIDPSADMLAEGRAGGGAAEYRRGEAAATGLGDASVALVTVAQAFHWFDVDAALAEFQRILEPGRRVAAVWNLRGESPFMTAYHELLRAFSREYSVLQSWEESLAELRAHPRVLEPLEIEAPHAQRFDFEGLHGRAWSSSYVFRGVKDREGFDAALRALFDACARRGVLEFPYRSVALVFRVASSARIASAIRS
ncbi:MAG TPA: methyltransferase domain-containing protein [Vicinamibacteria bacterium]|nr:methyltransferase domain-containing protein [Vicinamibacteria bacterium]